MELTSGDSSSRLPLTPTLSRKGRGGKFVACATSADAPLTGRGQRNAELAIDDANIADGEAREALFRRVAFERVNRPRGEDGAQHGRAGAAQDVGVPGRNTGEVKPININVVEKEVPSAAT